MKLLMMLMKKMMTKIQEGEVLGEEEVEGVETTECRQDHHQIYMVETLQQKIQDVLLKRIKKDFKIED